MNCGDVLYRSTLDPVLRREERGFVWQGVALLGLGVAYLTATPGVLQGAWDMYFDAPIQRRKSAGLELSDIDLGRKLATGGFGTVYRATLKATDEPVIVKKANEFGEAEVWMNERMKRAAPAVLATFIDAFDDGSGNEDAPTYLVWEYEGDCTLAALLLKKGFPYTLEPYVLGRALRLPEGPRRQAEAVKAAIIQLVGCLKECHAVGIVHRDVKPQNLILSEKAGRIKLIDFGAATDLRVGKNYVPEEYLLDPRYAPPQQYIMSKLTPQAPSEPVAAFLSPVLWRLNHPDRFDMYSVGIILLQMAFPTLRSDNGICAFNKAFEGYDFDLRKWRKDKEGTKALQPGFDMLDLQGGQGWQLLCSLLAYNPADRPSATAVLAHPWLNQSRVASVLGTASGAVGELGKALGNSGVQDILEGRRDAGLSEAELSGEFTDEPYFTPPPRQGNSTKAWFSARQNDIRRQRSKLSRFVKTVSGR